ncbi:MAG: hypothetical protein R6U56_07875, partial [Opitutales bacterium]
MIGPGKTIGILGGGQLGRMLILAGRPLGYRFHVFEPKGHHAGGAGALGLEDVEAVAERPSGENKHPPELAAAEDPDGFAWSDHA